MGGGGVEFKKHKMNSGKKMFFGNDIIYFLNYFRYLSII